MLAVFLIITYANGPSISPLIYNCLHSPVFLQGPCYSHRSQGSTSRHRLESYHPRATALVSTATSTATAKLNMDLKQIVALSKLISSAVANLEEENAKTPLPDFNEHDATTRLTCLQIMSAASQLTTLVRAPETVVWDTAMGVSCTTSTLLQY